MITIREAAIISAYTGMMLGEFRDFHKYAEHILGRPIFTHEFASENLVAELREKSKPDFVGLFVETVWR